MSEIWFILKNKWNPWNEKKHLGSSVCVYSRAPTPPSPFPLSSRLSPNETAVPEIRNYGPTDPSVGSWTPICCSLSLPWHLTWTRSDSVRDARNRIWRACHRCPGVSSMCPTSSLTRSLHMRGSCLWLTSSTNSRLILTSSTSGSSTSVVPIGARLFKCCGLGVATCSRNGMFFHFFGL